MAANRVTPVVLNCSTVTDRPKISFRIADNKLGEQPYKITLTSADTSTKWKDGDDHIYEYYTGSETSTIPSESGFDLYSNEELLSTISGKIVTVTYESKSAIVTETITMPTVTANGPNNVNLNVPYLFSENFSTIKTYDGDYTAGPYTNVGDASTAARDLSQYEYGLSAGWSGARTAGSEGKAILVGGRVDETTVAWIGGTTNAFGRLDSPTMKNLKSGAKVDIIVRYDYSGNRDDDHKAYSAIGAFGYTTESGLINGYATQQILTDSAETFSNIEGYKQITDVNLTGSWDSITQKAEYKISGCERDYRLSWHYVVTGKAGGGWTTANANYWMYIDNIKVQIASE